MKLKTWQKDLLKGSALGTGILPGVSVGTVGFIVNIYDKLINSLAGLKSKKTFKSSLIALIPIGFGCLLFTFLFLFFWKRVAYEYFPFVTIAILAGFVLGGLPVMTKELKGAPLTWRDFLRIGIGFVFALSIGVVSFLSAAGIVDIDMEFYEQFANPFSSPWVYLIVLGVGLISAVACLIPGISGSMIMFIFGLFNPVVTIFISGKRPDGTILPYQASIFEDQTHMWPRLLLIAVLLVGMLVGFVATSVAMRKLLDTHRRGTFGYVIGFVVGSIISMFVNNEMYFVYINPQTNQWWQFVIGAILGAATAVGAYFLIQKAIRREAAEAEKAVTDTAE